MNESYTADANNGLLLAQTNTGVGRLTTAGAAAPAGISIGTTGNVGMGTTAPTAALHLKAGTASASTAPLKFTAGTNLTAAEAGAMEWDGTNLSIAQTAGPTRKTIAYTDSNVTGTAANVTGVVAIANGGTGSATQNFVDLTTAQTVGGAKTLSAVLAVSDATDASNTTTASLKTAGGLGVVKKAYFGDLVSTAASTTTNAGLRLPHGAAPTTPTDGDLWTTTGGLYARINGATVGPFGAAGGSYMDLTSAQTAAGAKTFSSPLTISGTGANELAVTGAPAASATSSLVQVGGAIAGGDASADGGTYIGVNAPNAGAGSAADLMNLQKNGTSVFKVTNAGNVQIPNTTNATTGVISKGSSPFIHNYAAAGSDGYNTFVGSDAGNFTMAPGGGDPVYYASYNTAVGKWTLNANTTGYSNTAIGVNALVSNTTGAINTATGRGALHFNNTGSYNVASGYAALVSNNGGNSNSAFGTNALLYNISGSGSVAVGSGALYNTDADANNAIGANALYLNTAGTGNSALGYAAGNGTDPYGGTSTANTTGDHNVFIGTSTGVTDAAADYSRSVALGYHAHIGASDAIILGGTGADAVKVGIGTSAPTATMHLKAGTTTASTAPLKFTAGANLTTPEAGAVEWDGTNLSITQTTGPTRKTIAYTDSNVTGTAANVTGVVAIANGGTGSATQNFVDLTTAQTAAGAKTFSSPLTISGTGATELAVTGSPAASATSSLVRFGDAITNGDANGTWIGLNAPVASTADLVHLQHNGEWRFAIEYDGDAYFSNLLTTATPGSTGAGLRVPHGTKPDVPGNGDLWTTTAGLFTHINGATVGPYTPSQWVTSGANIHYSSATTITIGQTNLLSTSDDTNGDKVMAQEAILPETATIQSLSFYVTTAVGNLRMGIYDATGPSGDPGTLLAETAEFTPVVGWNTANVTTPVSLAAGTYWLAYFPQSDGLQFLKHGTAGQYRYYSIAYGAMPGTFTTTGQGADHWSFYATFATHTGNVGVGTSSPTAALHLKAGTAAASTAPLKFTAGTNLTTPEAGAMEWNGTNLFVTQTAGPTRKTIAYTDSNVTGTAANVTGVVAVANGGTGSATQNFVDLSTAQTVGGAKTLSAVLAVSDATDASNTTTASLKTAGGLGVVKKAYFGDLVSTAASTTTNAGLRLPHGAAPTAPVDGDLWTTTGGLYARINSATVGPFGTGAGSQWTTTGSDIYYNSTGKVGIGVAPTDLLTVQGAAAGAQKITIKNTTNTGTAQFTALSDNASWVETGIWGSAHAITQYRNQGYMATGNSMYLYTSGAAQNGGSGSMYFLTGGWDDTTQTRMTILSTGNVGIGDTSPAAKLSVGQPVATSGTPKLALLTGAAHTGLTASTEAPDVDVALNRTVQFATGALATQRAAVFRAPTYGFVGASTLTDAATVAITGAPVQGTNATITNSHGLLIQAGAVSTATNAYGLTVNAPTGATNNYVAAFRQSSDTYDAGAGGGSGVRIISSDGTKHGDWYMESGGGMRFRATNNNYEFNTNGVPFRVNTTSVSAGDDVRTLGASSARWSTIFASTGLRIGNGTTGSQITDSSGALTLAAGGTDQNVVLTPSGTGVVSLNGPTTLAAGKLLTTAASTTTNAGLRLPHGAAPTAPTDGDLWTTTAGLYARVNGATVGPMGVAGGSSAFSAITSGTNTTATMTVGSGATLAATGTGTITATGMIGANSAKVTDSSGKLQLQAGGTGTGTTGTGSIYFLDSGGTSRGRLDTVVSANATATNAGSGGDGAITIAASKNLNTTIIGGSRVTYADGIAYRVVAPISGATTVTRYSGSDTLSNGIAANDLLLLINLQGASGDVACVGRYEVMTVDSVSASTITFTAATTKAYDGTSAANQKVVVQRIPQYTNVTVQSGGIITASAWEGLTTTPSGAAGYLTGIVAFKASGTLTVDSGGAITASSLGYRGGSGGAAGANGGNNGESYDGTNGRGGSGSGNGETLGGGRSGDGALASPANGATRGGGGGGGSDGSGASNNTGGGGGAGGGYASGGGGGGGGARSSSIGGLGGVTGAKDTPGGGGGGAGSGASGMGGGGGLATAGQTGGAGGTGGEVGAGSIGGSGGGGGNSTTAGGGGGGGGGNYGTTELTTLFHGSGGGGGGAGTNAATAGQNGGAGGGIVFVSAATVSVAGTVTCGGSSGSNTSGNGAGASGGGAGGSVLIGGSAVTIGTNLVSAGGGAGGGGNTRGGGGGSGGQGRLRVECTTSLSGSTSAPAASTVAPSTYGVLHIGSVDTTNADLAEYYVAGDPSIGAGDVVALTSLQVSADDGRTVANKGVLRLASGAYDQQAIGIVSTAPGVMLGTIDRTDGNRGDCKLALAGRVPTRVSVENGPIQVGDRLTASSTPGVAMRATKPGRCIGIALESFADAAAFREGRIMVFVRADWYVGDNIAGADAAQASPVAEQLLDPRGDLAAAYRGQLLIAEQVRQLTQEAAREVIAALQAEHEQRLRQVEARMTETEQRLLQRIDELEAAGQRTNGTEAERQQTSLPTSALQP